MLNCVKLNAIGLLTLLVLCLCTQPSSAATSKGTSNKIVTAKKTYKVPGVVAIATAKRHGYRFAAKNRVKNRRKGCQFMGAHWSISSKKSCQVSGFYSRKQKCRALRNGWKVKAIKLKGNYVWVKRPESTRLPLFLANTSNQSTKAQVITIDEVILEGPVGAANSWERAFSHCSDSNYQANSSR